ncbi:hypothetical protein Misp04_57550 [Micromonospora sp. NBRC 101691]|nr:hypothetical protein Misp04_57550 [Micromonospora sp. NBRC 101691]
MAAMAVKEWPLPTGLIRAPAPAAARTASATSPVSRGRGTAPATLRWLPAQFVQAVPAGIVRVMCASVRQGNHQNVVTGKHHIAGRLVSTGSVTLP